ncbi:hypothetical protein REPUB_Repub13aG0087200 [Reevesia pubescens]
MSTMEESKNFQGSMVARPMSLKKVTNFNSKKEDEEAFLKSLPPGYRFKPFDGELVNYYLKRKIYNKPLPTNRIRDVELYKYNPETLTEISNNKSSNGTINEWYFFTPRDRKYRNGKRPDRAAGDGFWKATGADKPVMWKGNLVGLKKTLVFYRGKPPKGKKTNWIMHEYVLSNPPAIERTSNGDDMQLDKWVLCRIYKKEKEAKSKPGTPQHSTDKKRSIPAGQTETQNQEYGIPQSQSDHQQFQVKDDFNMLPPKSCLMPYYDNAFDDNNSTFPQLSFDQPILGHESTKFSQQAISDYGSFMSTALPLSSISPPDQFHYMDNLNFNIDQPQHQHQHQQQQFSGVPNNFDFSAADQFILHADF